MDRLQPKLIRAQTCSSCAAKYAAPGGPIECRLNPPTVAPILGGDPQTGFRLLGNVTLFPVVQPDQWCKQYRRAALDERLSGMAVEDLRAS